MLQVYPENLAQRELILGFAMRAGFSGGVVVDFPHRYIKDYACHPVFNTIPCQLPGISSL